MIITPAVDPLFSFSSSFWAISFPNPPAYSALIGHYRHRSELSWGPGASRSLETHLLLILKLPVALVGALVSCLSASLSRCLSHSACMPCQFKLFSNGRYEEPFLFGLHPPTNQQILVSSFFYLVSFSVPCLVFSVDPFPLLGQSSQH